MTFRSYHASFSTLLGEEASIELLLEEKLPLFHEAGVFVPDRNELFITSNRLFDDHGNQSVTISRIKVDQNDQATRETVVCDEIVMGNGGVNYKDGIIFCDQGSRTSPSGLHFFKPDADKAQAKTSLLISSFHGRPFNSVNDVVVHSDGSIWFTDPTYGYEQGYRPAPRLPSQVYRWQPSDSSIRAMADGFGHPNGICFSPDETIVYITDTDWISGAGVTDDTKASSIYAFDVVHYAGQPFLTNRRLFAMCDTGIPDGIKCDMEGNVYSGCGDGLNIWSPGGVLIGKILLSGGVANFCFGREGEVYLLNEEKLWRAKLNSKIRGALLRV